MTEALENIQLDEYYELKNEFEYDKEHHNTILAVFQSHLPLIVGFSQAPQPSGPGIDELQGILYKIELTSSTLRGFVLLQNPLQLPLDYSNQVHVDQIKYLENHNTRPWVVMTGSSAMTTWYCAWDRQHQLFQTTKYIRDFFEHIKVSVAFAFFC